MTNKYFDFETQYATYRNCMLQVNKYTYSNTVAVSVWSPEEGPITTLTTCLGNVDGVKLKPNEGFIDTNNNPAAPELLKELGIATPVTMYGEPIVAFSGYCKYPLYEFNVERLREFDPKGVKEVFG